MLLWATIWDDVHEIKNEFTNKNIEKTTTKNYKF